MCIYAVNLNENRAFQNVSREKCVKIADFWRIKRIFTQLIVKKGESFADFRQIKRIFTLQTRKISRFLPIFGEANEHLRN